jgi:hypothetical protein
MYTCNREVYIKVYFFFQQEYVYNRETYKRFIPPPLDDLLSKETYAPYDYIVSITLIMFNSAFATFGKVINFITTR